MALEAGRSVQWVAGILGHSSPTITLQTYAHVLPRAEDGMGLLTELRGESADLEALQKQADEAEFPVLGNCPPLRTVFATILQRAR